MSSRRTIVVDSDPWSTVGFGLLCILIALSIVISMGNLLGGESRPLSVGWIDHFAAVSGLGLALAMRDRHIRAMRFGCLLWGGSHAVKLFLYWSGVSSEAAAAFMPGFTISSIAARVFWFVFLIQMFCDMVRFEPAGAVPVQTEDAGPHDSRNQP